MLEYLQTILAAGLQPGYRLKSVLCLQKRIALYSLKYGLRRKLVKLFEKRCEDNKKS